MAIANGTCLSFCRQPKAHYLTTVTPVSRCLKPLRVRHLATSRVYGTFWPPWVRPWDYRG